MLFWIRYSLRPKSESRYRSKVALISLSSSSRSVAGRQCRRPPRSVPGHASSATAPTARCAGPADVSASVSLCSTAIGKRPGTYGGVQHLQVGDGGHQRITLHVCHAAPIFLVLAPVAVIEQAAQRLLPRLRVAFRGCLLRERGHQRLVHHVVHHLARRVVRSGLLARGIPRLRVVGRQQVLKHLPQQLRVQRHFLFCRRVLLHRELVALEQPDQARLFLAFVKEERVGDGVTAPMGLHCR